MSLDAGKLRGYSRKYAGALSRWRQPSDPQQGGEAATIAPAAFARVPRALGKLILESERAVAMRTSAAGIPGQYRRRAGSLSRYRFEVGVASKPDAP